MKFRTSRIHHKCQLPKCAVDTAIDVHIYQSEDFISFQEQVDHVASWSIQQEQKNSFLRRITLKTTC